MFRRVFGDCTQCRHRRRLAWQPPRLYAHSLLVVLTLGAWFPVWLAVVLFGGGWVCRDCGQYVRACR